MQDSHSHGQGHEHRASPEGEGTEIAHAPGHYGGHHSHHAHMVADFRRRFWVSLALALPVLALAPLIQSALGVAEAWDFPGDSFVQFAFASVIFFYGGRPFLHGLFQKLSEKRPGMMTLIALAISVAYGYSSLVVFGLPGQVFFWELATLIDIMLLGHWIEMRSVMGASAALLNDPRVHELAVQGKTIVYVLVVDELEGAIALPTSSAPSLDRP